MQTTSSPTSSEPSRAPNRSAALFAWLFLAGIQIVLAFSASLAEDTEREGLEPVFRYEVALGGAFAYSLILLCTALIAHFAYGEVRNSLGLRRFALRWVWIALGVVVLALFVSAALEPLLHAGEEQGLAPERWRPEHVGAFVANAAVIVTLGPFAEELFFRGLGIPALAGFGGTTAIVATSIVFGLAHGILVALPPLVFFALGLAWVRLHSESVWPAFLAHAAYNGIGILVALYLALNPDEAQRALGAIVP